MPYGLTRADGQPLTSNQFLRVTIQVRKTEVKHAKKAIMALDSFTITLPGSASKDIKCWQKDKVLKAALEEHLLTVAGIAQTTNPLKLRVPLI